MHLTVIHDKKVCSHNIFEMSFCFVLFCFFAVKGALSNMKLLKLNLINTLIASILLCNTNRTLDNFHKAKKIKGMSYKLPGHIGMWTHFCRTTLHAKAHFFFFFFSF